MKNSKSVRQIDIESGKVIRIFPSTVKASRFLARTRAEVHIRQCCIGERKTAYGYKWEYVD